MKNLILTSLLTMPLDCSELGGHELMESEKWKKSVCIKLTKDYENVVLTPISSKYKKILSQKNNQDVHVYPPLAGRVKVKHVVNIEGEGYQEITSIYFFQGYKEVWVFKKNIRSGEVLKKNDFVKKKINIGPYVGIRNFDINSPLGMTTIKPVAKGSLLYEEIIAAPALIKANDKLTVVFHSNNLKIKTLGVALEKGINLQDEIKVRIVDTGAVFNGIIIGEKDVYVEM